jgi:anti-anti-sigma regulatory factor
MVVNPIRLEPGLVVTKVAGRLDGDTGPELRMYLLADVRSRSVHTLVLDLTRVAVTTAAGLSAVADVAARAIRNGVALLLVARDAVRRAWAGVESRPAVAVHRTLADALADAQRGTGGGAARRPAPGPASAGRDGWGDR